MNTCDLCDSKAEYLLCQIHMDDMRFLDTFSTADGDYPIPGVIVLWAEEGCDTNIGGYDPEFKTWFSDEDTTPNNPVIWCNLPDLQSMYKYTNSSISHGVDEISIIKVVSLGVIVAFVLTMVILAIVGVL